MRLAPLAVSAALVFATTAAGSDPPRARPRNIVSLAGGWSAFPTTYGGATMGPSFGLQYERVFLDVFSLSLRPAPLLTMGRGSEFGGWAIGLAAKWFPRGDAPEGLWLSPEVLFIAGIYAWDVRDAQVGFLQAAPGANLGYTWLAGWLSMSAELGTNVFRVKGSSPAPDWDRNGPEERVDTVLFDVHARMTIGLAF